MKKELIVFFLLIIIMNIILLSSIYKNVYTNAFYEGEKSSQDERLTNECKYLKVNNKNMPSYCYDYLEVEENH